MMADEQPPSPPKYVATSYPDRLMHGPSAKEIQQRKDKERAKAEARQRLDDEYNAAVAARKKAVSLLSS